MIVFILVWDSFKRLHLSNSYNEYKQLMRALLIILATAIAQAIRLPEQIQISIFLLVVPGLGPIIKTLQALDRYNKTKNLVILFIEIIFIAGMVDLQLWFFKQINKRRKK